MPASPGGIAGPALLSRMREQAEKYGARVEAGEVVSLTAEPGHFTATTAGETVRARTVLLATGVFNRRPAMPAALHDEALSRGKIRYCPICDGYEVTDRAVGVIGTGEPGVGEAEFLRSYTADVTLIAPEGGHDLEPAQKAQLASGGIRLIDGPCLAFELHADQIRVRTPDGVHVFDALYPALGSDARSDLAVAIGAEATSAGCLAVDGHQRTTIPGLYAAGDVVLGLDQISHAMGQAGVAATTIRNDLADRHPLRRR